MTTPPIPSPTVSPNQRQYDVVLYGATGFVGQQTAAYFAQHAKGLRWAIAGRSQAKLDAVRSGLQGAAGIDTIVADAQDSAALTVLAASTRVVLTSAGPYALYGSALLAACVQQRSHYVDITGETPWIRAMIDAHHAKAQAQGTRIVPCCGFDSVPSDLGAYLVAREMLRRHGEPCVDVKASFSIRGGLNGGTLASVLNIMDAGHIKAFANPFLLNPGHQSSPADAAHSDPIAPHYDKDFKAWLGPFFMGPINTRVVRRTAALQREAGLGMAGAAEADTAKADAVGASAVAYADNFHYQEYLRFGAGALAGTVAAGVSAGALATQAALKLRLFRRLAAAALPKPGEGPSVQSMDGGSFRCALVGRSASGHTVRASINCQGDPGNRATTLFVCESAMALAGNSALLPGGAARGGVLTPAFALGDVLASRLKTAGIKIDIEPAAPLAG